MDKQEKKAENMLKKIETSTVRSFIRSIKAKAM